MVATLTRIFGIEHLTLAEDVVQEALARALQTWPFYGIPENPSAWIMRVSRNLALDHARRASLFRHKEAEIAAFLEHPETTEPVFTEAEIQDDRLRMIFACCHPQVPQDAQVALALKTLCGFSTAEIASAFLSSETAVAKRLTRAKQRIREARIPFEIPAGAELSARLESVLQTLYLLFNEGYHGSDAERLLQPALVADAVRLAELLLAADGIERSTVHALAALFHFNAARLPGRLDDDGVVLPLADQDRARWDRAHFERGIMHLGESASGEELTRYHLEAGIAFEHTRASSVEATDWAKILEYYALLGERTPSPVVALNHAVALAEVRGLDAGRAALTALEADPKLAQYSFYWAARADVERRAGNAAAAREHYERATALARSAGERRSYERRMAALSPSRRASA